MCVVSVVSVVYVVSVVCVLSGRSLCLRLITHSEESYQVWCV